MNLKLMGLLVAGAALALAGCGGGTGSVSGVVKHKGQPLKGGTISFYGRSSGVWSRCGPRTKCAANASRSTAVGSS